MQTPIFRCYVFDAAKHGLAFEGDPLWKLSMDQATDVGDDDDEDGFTLLQDGLALPREADPPTMARLGFISVAAALRLGCFDGGARKRMLTNQLPCFSRL